jgi:hypothetical protein
MNANFEKAMNAVREQYENLEKTVNNLVVTRESAVKFPYDLRAFIEGEVRKKTDPTKILEDVIAKLKAVTPHGKDSVCDQ